jgi:hypothetical protein
VELKLGVEASVVALDSEGKIGEGSLGFLNITANDHDTAAPEVQLQFAFDLPAGDAGGLAGGGLTPQVSGHAGLDLDLATDLSTDLLPIIKTELVVDFPLTGTFPFFTPSVALNDITIDLTTYFGVLSDTLGEIGGVFDTAPFGQLFDAIMGPIPVIDDAAHLVPELADALDKDDNGNVSLLDLARVSGFGG